MKKSSLLMTVFMMVFLMVTSILYAHSPRLINGTPADPKDWPASLDARFSGAGCTATLVGDKVLLVAAHCVSTGGSASVKVNGTSFTGRCTRAKDYASNNTADWALCSMTSAISGVPYERINSDPGLVHIDDTLTLTGYGCIQPGGGGGNNGIYRIGKSKVIRVPAGSSNDIITRGGAALCFGDSGGPAFLINSQTGERFLVAVNSRGDISTTSYLSSISTQSALDFVDEWSRANGLKVCGYHEDAMGCR